MVMVTLVRDAKNANFGFMRALLPRRGMGAWSRESLAERCDEAEVLLKTT